MATHLQLHNLFFSTFTTKQQQQQQQQHTTTLSFTSKSSPFKLFTTNETDSSKPISQDSSSETTSESPASLDPVKVAFERAKSYKKQKSLQASNSSNGSSNNEDTNESMKKVLMEKANEYKKSKGIDVIKVGSKSETVSGSKETTEENLGSGFSNTADSKKEKVSISSIDFVGLNFSDKKKSKGLPAGLVPVPNPFPETDLTEVEIIVGDTSKFGDSSKTMPRPSEGDSGELYKPKVSTWGVFPRPGNISKTFGGGRTIRPGDLLESAEERAAKDEHTRQLLAAYRKKVGLNVDPKLKYECEKVLKDGDSLMDSGKLHEALPYYKKVMDMLPFQSELHGLAALQWSICQDSLRRSNEARVMYEKLQSHPNAQVNKKARQFMFSFQAMEMMKVTSGISSNKNTGYQNYFEAFVEDKVDYNTLKKDEIEGVLNQALPYMILLVSPVFLVLFIALQERNIN